MNHTIWLIWYTQYIMVEIIFLAIKWLRYIILSDFHLCKNDFFWSYQLKCCSKRSFLLFSNWSNWVSNWVIDDKLQLFIIKNRWSRRTYQWRRRIYQWRLYWKCIKKNLSKIPNFTAVSNPMVYGWFECNELDENRLVWDQNFGNSGPARTKTKQILNTWGRTIQNGHQESYKILVRDLQNF